VDKFAYPLGRWVLEQTKYSPKKVSDG